MAEPSPVGLDLDAIEAAAHDGRQLPRYYTRSTLLALCAEVRRLQALKATDDGAYQHVVEMFHNDRAELERLQAIVDGPFVDARTELAMANSEIERLRAELRAKPYAMAFNRTELAEQVATLRAERDALRDQRDRLLGDLGEALGTFEALALLVPRWAGRTQANVGAFLDRIRSTHAAVLAEVGETP